MPRLETSSVRDIGLSDDYRCLVELLARGMYLPYLECISENISYLSRMISQYRARHLQKKFTKLYTTTEAAVTLHYAPPPHQALIRQHLPKQPQTTSPLSPTGRLWDHPSLRGRSRRSAPQHKTNPPNPPPVGKAGFDVWVLTKGGLVCLATCRPVRTVGSNHPSVHAHHVGRYAEP